MNPQPTEQRVRPRPPRHDRHGAVLPKTPSRLLVVEKRALPNGAAPYRSDLPVAEHLASAPSTRRISVVESVAIQIFSGAIEFGFGEQKVSGAGHTAGSHGWPLLLNRDQLCEYLGASWRTLKNVLTVRPVDMGANVIRYSRVEIDDWVATLPPRLLASKKNGTDEEAGAKAEHTEEADIAESRVEAALDRVRARAGGSKWRKTT